MMMMMMVSVCVCEHKSHYSGVLICADPIISQIPD